MNVPHVAPALGAEHQKIAEETPANGFGISVENEADFSLDRIALTKHNFHKHPLLQLDQLEALAHRLLPLKQCRFMAPGVTVGSDFIHHSESPDGKALSEVFKNISEPGTWVALYNAEQDPQYAALLEEALSSVRHLIDREQPDVFLEQTYIFISAPPSVTPFHIDRQNNFWLQVHGRKTINVWDRNNRRILPATTIENFIIDFSLNDVTFRDEFWANANEWDLGPGEGVYIPITSPHSTRTVDSWVTQDDSVSVSIAIVFYTEKTRRHSYIHIVNRVMRRFNLSPKFPGESPFDGAKYYLGRVLVGIKQLLRDYQPPVGF